MARLVALDLVAAAGDRRIGPIAFTLEGGGCLSLEGPSGSGKSTLLRALSGLDAAVGGRVELDGVAPAGPQIPAYRRRVLLLGGGDTLGPDTAEAALQRPFGFRSSPAPYPAARARDLAESLGIAELFDRAVVDLSTGERQRLALLRALLVAPDFLLADEPTSALDPDNTAAAEGLLRAAMDRGLGLVLVSHDPAQRARLGDQTVRLP